MESDYSSEPSSSDDEDIPDYSSFLINMINMQLNKPGTKQLVGYGEHQWFQGTLTDDNWEMIGGDIAKNTYLNLLEFSHCYLDDQKMTPFFRGLNRSSSINDLQLHSNEFSAAGVRSMVPFLQNANNLTCLCLDDNNIQSEGFNVLFHALRDSPIETLNCKGCGIESIEIDDSELQLVPKNLTILHLGGNKITSDGCRGLAKLLQAKRSSLTTLHLDDNKIDDEGVAILVDALKTNTCLKHFYTVKNDEITVEGMKLCLRLVNDISSINATLQSNHTLQNFYVSLQGLREPDSSLESVETMNSITAHKTIQYLILISVKVTKDVSKLKGLDRVGMEKIRQLQLNSCKRKEMADWQGVTRSLYSEINPLHLPEVLALVGRIHGRGELYIALKSSIAGVISTVNRRECIQQQRTYHASKLKELDAELAAMDDADRRAVGIECGESRSSKRLRNK